MVNKLLRNASGYSVMAALVREFQEKRVEVSVDKWWLSSNSISVFVFVSGKTGVGKSTLVNALLGEKVAKEGITLDPETSVVESFNRLVARLIMVGAAVRRT